MTQRAREELSPGKKAQNTSKWARTMTKWLFTYSHQGIASELDGKEAKIFSEQDTPTDG